MFRNCHIYHGTIEEPRVLKQTYFYGALELTDKLSIGIVRECVTRGRIVRLDNLSNIQVAKYARVTPVSLGKEEYKRVCQLQTQRVTLPPHFNFYPEQIMSLLKGERHISQTTYNPFRFARMV